MNAVKPLLTAVAAVTLAATSAQAVPVDVNFDGSIVASAETPSLDGARFDLTFQFDTEGARSFGFGFGLSTVSYFSADSIALSVTDRPGGTSDIVAAGIVSNFIDILLFDNLRGFGDGVYFRAAFDLNNNGFTETVFEFISQNSNDLFASSSDITSLNVLRDVGPRLDEFTLLNGNIGSSSVALENVTASGTGVGLGAVPLPASMLLLGTAFSAIALIRRRKPKRSTR
ncbi:MAG: VPLPA-CTERM sorting domain-containing protein [Litoreibacter sp.]